MGRLEGVVAGSKAAAILCVPCDSCGRRKRDCCGRKSRKRGTRGAQEGEAGRSDWWLEGGRDSLRPLRFLRQEEEGLLWPQKPQEGRKMGRPEGVVGGRKAAAILCVPCDSCGRRKRDCCGRKSRKRGARWGGRKEWLLAERRPRFFASLVILAARGNGIVVAAKAARGAQEGEAGRSGCWQGGGRDSLRPLRFLRQEEEGLLWPQKPQEGRKMGRPEGVVAGSKEAAILCVPCDSCGRRKRGCCGRKSREGRKMGRPEGVVAGRKAAAILCVPCDSCGKRKRGFCGRKSRKRGAGWGGRKEWLLAGRRPQFFASLAILAAGGRGVLAAATRRPSVDGMEQLVDG